MVKTIDATTTDRLRRSPLYIWTVSKLRSQASLHGVNHNQPRLSTNPQSAGNMLEAVEGVGEDCAAEKGENDGHLVA